MNTLLALTQSGSVLIVLLFLLKLCLGKRLVSTVYYYAWLIVMLRFILPIPGLIPVGTQEKAMPVRAYMEFYQFPELSGDSGTVNREAGQTESARSEAYMEMAEPVHQVAAKETVQINWKSQKLWLTVWMAGAALSFALYTISYFHFAGRIRRELKSPVSEDILVYKRFKGRKPQLYRSENIKTPMMIGVLHPMIILPDLRYTDEKLMNILRHELMHYKRRDTLYKWFAVLVYALQWFNPLCYLMRSEVSRACELSCDEMLLRHMDRNEKQSYGDTLLSMAATASLPAGVVATTFATEKKTLKERLEQIMHSKMTRSRIIASLLAFVLLAGCALVTGPQSLADDSTQEVKTVEVSDVDGLLAAIADNTVIVLGEGTYDLTAASSYGKESGSKNWHWSDEYDGPELVIEKVSNLTIRGAGKDTTIISALPRYADVFYFTGCYNITLENFTAGHTEQPAYCAGCVINMDNTQNMCIDGCGFYGCGTIGISAANCRDISVNNTEIYDCSMGAVNLSGCRGVSFDGCEIRHHSSATEPSVSWLFYLDSSDDIRITNSLIHDNYAQWMLLAGYSRNVVFAGNTVAHNSFLSGVFSADRYSPVVEGCSFTDNSIINWYAGNGIFAVDGEGNTLGVEDLKAMNQRTIAPDEALAPTAGEKAASELVARSEDGAYHVSTVDELLSVIGSERTIILEAEFYDLTTASDYGTPGGEHYFWREGYDGPELVITGVHDLTIDASKPEGENAAMHHTISATPRYADVLSFQYCDNIALMNFTAGHTQEPGSCAGGVLNFQNCSGVYLMNCRMYGCGVLGLETANCTNIMANSCEIYDCSQGGVQMSWTDGVSFIDCSIHDVPSPALSFFQSGDKTWNGKPMLNNGDYSMFDVTEDGELTEFTWPDYEGEEYVVAEPEPEIDYNLALHVAKGELKKLQDLGILNSEIAFDGELDYASYVEEYTREGRTFAPSFIARDYTGKYFINLRIDSASGAVRSATIEANHDEDDEPMKDREIEINGEVWQYYNNFDDIFPEDLTVSRLCDLLAEYWGYSGWTLADIYDEFYEMRMNAPAEDLLISELPENNYYATVYFDGDQEGAPMYFQIARFPGRVMFLFGDGHLVG